METIKDKFRITVIEAIHNKQNQEALRKEMYLDSGYVQECQNKNYVQIYNSSLLI